MWLLSARILAELGPEHRGKRKHAALQHGVDGIGWTLALEQRFVQAIAVDPLFSSNGYVDQSARLKMLLADRYGVPLLALVGFY